jgi:hypothetical protein
MEDRLADGDGVDLREFDDVFGNAALVDRNTPPPDGTYQATIDTLQVTRAKDAQGNRTGNPMVKWGLRIVGPTCAGRILWRHNTMATPENIAWLKTDLHTAGLDIEKLSDLPAHLEELIGVVLEVTKRTRGENSNVYINQRVGTAEDLGTGDVPF